MGKRGPRPKPTELKKRAGNPGKRRLNKSEPTPAAVERAPDPPAWLNTGGIEEWRAIVPHLQTSRLLTAVDLVALAVYCQCVGQYIECQAWVAKHGLTMKLKTANGSLYRQQAPELGIALKLAEKIKQFAHEFGLTPSARVGLVVEQAKPADRLTSFRKRKSG